MKEARWWHIESDGKILGTLCPRFCRMGNGQVGFCYIRKNGGGKLYSLGYAVLPSIRPKKKPPNHLLPGFPTGVDPPPMARDS